MSYEPKPLALSLGGTGQTTKAAAFDALSPMIASGDIIYGGTAGTGTRLAKGSDGQVLTLTSGLPSWAAAGSVMAWTSMSGLSWNGLGTVANTSYWYKTIGDTLYVRGVLQAGTVAASTFYVDITNATGGTYAIQSSKFSNQTNTQKVGYATKLVNPSASTTSGQMDLMYDGSDTAKIFVCESTASYQYTKKNGSNTLSTSDYFNFYFEVPIS